MHSCKQCVTFFQSSGCFGYFDTFLPRLYCWLSPNVCRQTLNVNTHTHTHTHTTHTHYKRNRYLDMTPSWVNPEGSYSLSRGQVSQGNEWTSLVWNPLKWNLSFSWTWSSDCFLIWNRINSGISITLHRRDGQKGSLRLVYFGFLIFISK
jgi:hypothetical protein